MQLKDLNLNYLYNFWVVAHRQSISKAANSLGKTQSTVSAQLANLEEFLGGNLFERKHRSIELTSLGNFVFQYCESVFMNLHAMCERIEDPSLENVEDLSIGIMPSTPRYTLEEILLPLMKRKNLHLSIIEGSYEYLSEQMRNGKINFALTDVPRAKNSGSRLKSILMCQLNVCVVGRKGYLSLKKNFPYSLNGYPFIMLTKQAQVRKDTETLFEKMSINPRIIGEVQDIALLRRFALSGAGLAIIPRKAVLSDLRQKTLYEIGELQNLQSNLFMLLPEHKQKSHKHLDEIITILLERARKLY